MWAARTADHRRVFSSRYQVSRALEVGGSIILQSLRLGIDLHGIKGLGVSASVTDGRHSGFPNVS